MKTTQIYCDICNAELIESHQLTIARDCEVIISVDLCDEHLEKLCNVIDADWPGILERSK